MPLSIFSAGGVITPEGRLKLDDRAAFVGMCRTMQPGPVTVEVEVARSRHSQKARGYYRGVVLKLISEYTGHHPNELHEFFKRKFTQPVTRVVLGQRVEVWTTAEDDSAEFFDFVEHVRNFAFTDLDITTPDPDKRWKQQRDRQRDRQLVSEAQ